MTELDKAKESIRAIVEVWKRTNPQGQPEPLQLRQFNELLEHLYRQGWDYALGHENELPDNCLPQKYLRRRAQLIDELESELGDIASRYRGSQQGSEAEQKAISDYREVMEELFWIGHWPATLDPDAELPDEHMPPVYQDARRKRLEEYRATHKP